MKLTVPYASRVSLLMALLICLLVVGGGLGFSQQTTKAKRAMATSVPRPSRVTKPNTSQADTNATAQPKRAVQTRSRSIALATVPEPDTTDQTDLRGDYSGRISFPDGRVVGDATLTITGNEFVITTAQGGDANRIAGVFGVAQTQRYKAVALRILRPDGTSETLSLRLKQVGNEFFLQNVNEEDNTFNLAFQCPDPPGCMESDLCRPLCGKSTAGQTGSKPPGGKIPGF